MAMKFVTVGAKFCTIGCQKEVVPVWPVLFTAILKKDCCTLQHLLIRFFELRVAHPPIIVGLLQISLVG